MLPAERAVAACVTAAVLASVAACFTATPGHEQVRPHPAPAPAARTSAAGGFQEPRGPRTYSSMNQRRPARQEPSPASDVTHRAAHSHVAGSAASRPHAPWKTGANAAHTDPLAAAGGYVAARLTYRFDDLTG